MKIIEGKDGADLLPPWAYAPKLDTDLFYEPWKFGMVMPDALDKLAKSIQVLYQPIIDAIRANLKLDEIIKALPDEKAEARQRSREDMNRKRKELMKRRGRK